MRDNFERAKEQNNDEETLWANHNYQHHPNATLGKSANGLAGTILQV